MKYVNLDGNIISIKPIKTISYYEKTLDETRRRLSIKIIYEDGESYEMWVADYVTVKDREQAFENARAAIKRLVDKLKLDVIW